MGRIIAIDYGTKRTGLAVTDGQQIIATALDTVRSVDLLTYLKKYCAEENVESFVVGLPKQMNNTASETVKYVRTFIGKLEKEFPGMKVDTEDERFTSKIASQAILASGAKKSKRQDKSLVDKVSAVLILQSYLEGRKFR
ncbi:MAG: Holliday junction resolvase RuvX [Bacteroidales bacterium]|nr:Holliday junction resolvase RuvX [Bacteroidales bacterium]